jgi:ankyrin repeat protein
MQSLPNEVIIEILIFTKNKIHSKPLINQHFYKAYVDNKDYIYKSIIQLHNPRLKDIQSNDMYQLYKTLKRYYPEILYNDIHNTRLLQRASSDNHLEVVKLLLGYDEVVANIAARCNYALWIASQNGHLEIVKLLLSYNTVVANITAFNNVALRSASLRGRLEVVKLLLSYDEVVANITYGNNAALRYASQNGHLEVLKLLENAMK